MRLPFSNRNAELLVADLLVLTLAALTTVRDELAPSAVLEHGTVAWNAAVGTLLGREGVFLRSHHNAPGIGTAPLTPHCDVTVTEHDSHIQYMCNSGGSVVAAALSRVPLKRVPTAAADEL